MKTSFGTDFDSFIMHAIEKRDADRVVRRMDWKAKSILGASIVQQVRGEIWRATAYGDSVEYAMSSWTVY
jgi:uncharacterized protein YbjT (DUF2867 family)